jgi:signal transduction histidine kinase
MNKFVLIFFFCSISAFSQSSHTANLDSVLFSLKDLPDSIQVDSMVKISRQIVRENGSGEGLPYAIWALDKAKENHYLDLVPKARFYLANNYEHKNLLDSTVKHYKLALQEIKNTKHENWYGYIYNNLILALQKRGKYDEALAFAIEGLELAKVYQDTYNIAKSYSDIGYIHDRLNNFRESIKWQKKSIVLFDIVGESFKKYFAFTRVGIAYDDLGIYDSAHYYNQLALSYFVASNSIEEIGMVKSNIGNTYLKQKDWKNALDYLNEAYIFNKKVGDDLALSITAINLGKAHEKVGEIDLAKGYYAEGIRLSIALDDLKFQIEGNYSFYELFESQNQYDSALVYFKRYKMLEDSLYTLKKSEQIAEIVTQYETKEKEQQIALQQLTLKRQEAEIQSNRWLNFLLIVMILLVLVISIGTYFRYKGKKNAELQKLLIQEQERGLEAVIFAQEEERKRISKDLHDGIGQQLSGLKMAFQRMEKELSLESPSHKEELQRLTEILSESADEVRSLSHQMMPRALTELGIIAALEDLFSKSLGLTGIQYEFEHFEITGRLAERVEVAIYRIVQELINNIIKHSNAKMVQIQLFKNAGKIILIVEDNGTGFSKDSATSGHGLLNIKSRLNTIHGEVDYSPSPASGTVATIRIPLA